MCIRDRPCILYGELYTKYKSEIIKQVESKTDINGSKLKRSKANDVIIPCSGETAVDKMCIRDSPTDRAFQFCRTSAFLGRGEDFYF